MSHATSLTQLLQDPRIWCASQRHDDKRDTLETGFPGLDRQLTGHGWPRGSLIECLAPASGIGELSLWLPVMRRLCSEGRGLFWLDPPHLPYAPALAGNGLDTTRIFVLRTRDSEEQSWALEQILRCQSAGLALAWPHGRSKRPVRRLQLAAEAGDTLGVHLMSPQHNTGASTAHLRLALSPLPNQLEVAIRRQQGGHTATVTLPMAMPLEDSDSKAQTH